jgi:hypothetical protein
MRKLIPALALSCVIFGFPGMASAESLKASDCRPVTKANAAACCASVSLRSNLRPQEEALCRTRTQSTASPAAGLGGPPGGPGNGDDTNNPGDQRQNNGFGNGDDAPPGKSGPHNNAENASSPPRSSPGNSGH